MSGSLHDDVLMSMFTRFFIDDADKEAGKGVMRASELRLRYSDDLEDEIDAKAAGLIEGYTNTKDD